jgi:hypothetical protein
VLSIERRQNRSQKLELGGMNTGILVSGHLASLRISIGKDVSDEFSQNEKSKFAFVVFFVDHN